ncbi:permease prefix domain 1-containing protein [Geomicrobium sp. JCM 19055]|uniref:permease prefix domain 1-containing protein n=1 Tax=Geomicrobium sp. JCM 19055 TaxID=1460649 RepID=UPI00045ECD0D|nr:permease prefix domain 1-containing protein [Geomicrobium sp. JCM 19055]GAJ97604.1 hypothetical protein JCM19055_468 [Geomicrobium sp. JCM 19055]
MKDIRAHVEHLFRDIPNSEEKEAMLHDLCWNLEEKVRDLMETGKSEEDAINKAIVEFGDAEELKAELRESYPTNPSLTKRKKAKLNLHFSLWGSSLVILLFLFINFYYTPDTIWFIYPTFAILWWPLAMTFVYKRTEDK